MHSVRKLIVNILIFSLIITPIMHADDKKKENFWDKPANRALVITGASVGVIVLTMIAYSYNKKDVPTVSGSMPPPADKPATDSVRKRRLSSVGNAAMAQLQAQLVDIGTESGDESDGEGVAIANTRRLIHDQQEEVDQLSSSLDEEEGDDFDLEDSEV